MKGNHFATTEKNKKRTKSIVLSIVALMELILLVTSMTFSWFEPLSSLELEGHDFQTASVLNSHIEVGENKSTSSEDDVYSEVIDLNNFFDIQKQVRLSPVSSTDAKNFYASYDNNNTLDNVTDDKFRKLTTAEINSNLIQFSFNLSAPHGATDFYLTETLPIVYIGDMGYTYLDKETTPYRFAFDDGESTIIFRNNPDVANITQQAVSALNSNNTAILDNVSVLQNPQEYAYYTDHREITEVLDEDEWPVDVPIKPIFHLKKGETKTITVSIWNEAFDYTYVNNTDYKTQPGQKISFDIKLCSSWSINREITVYDYTAEQWIDNKGKSNEDTALFVRNADGDTNNRQYLLDYHADSKTWTGTIPIALQNCEFILGTFNNGRIADVHATFQSPKTRGDFTDITMFGDKQACVWGLKPEFDENNNLTNLVKIDFRDYTETSWIINKDDKGNDIDIAVEIFYDGRTLDYSMTNLDPNDPTKTTKDDNGKNSWSCWIPSTVNVVDFTRSGYNTSNVYKEFNRWHGDNRNGQTVYRALDGNGGTPGGDSDNGPFILYVKIDDEAADAFYNYNRGKNPAISFTGVANRTLWDGTSDKTTISRFDYVPNTDIWPNGESELTRSTDDPNTWYMTFEQKPAPGTYVTVWSRSGANNFNDVDSDMCFGVFYLFEDGKNYNTITITTAQKLTSTGASNNYALLGTMSSDGSGTGGIINPDGDIGTGEWGEEIKPTLTEGTYDSKFVHVSSNVDKVQVTFTWSGYEYTVDMEPDEYATLSGRTWTTNKIPDEGVTNIKFTDSNGKTWTDPGTNERDPYYYFFYAKDTNGNSTGWIEELYTTNSSYFYFKHYDASITSGKNITVSYEYEGVPFTYSLSYYSSNKSWRTKDIPGNDAKNVKYSDGTHTWNITNFSTSNRYCYALDGDQYDLRSSASFARIYLEHNWGWSDIKIYFTGTGGGNWNNRPAMIDLGRKYNGSPLYCYLVPTNAGLIIFTGRENNADKQTVDLTTNHNTDMRVFKFSNWNGSKGECSNDAISVSSLN